MASLGESTELDSSPRASEHGLGEAREEEPEWEYEYDEEDTEVSCSA